MSQCIYFEIAVPATAIIKSIFPWTIIKYEAVKLNGFKKNALKSITYQIGQLINCTETCEIIVLIINYGFFLISY